MLFWKRGRSCLTTALVVTCLCAAWMAPREERAIRDLLESYRRATEAQAVDAVAATHSDFPAPRRRALERYFENVCNLRVAIEDLDIAVVGDEAVATYTRTDRFVDAQTGRRMQAAVRRSTLLSRVNGAWKFRVEE